MKDWSKISTDDIALRIYNRAMRLARLIDMKNAPLWVIANEKKILDDAYTAWANRTGAKPISLEEPTDSGQTGSGESRH
jgi:hypothetical protein